MNGGVEEGGEEDATEDEAVAVGEATAVSVEAEEGAEEAAAAESEFAVAAVGSAM